MTRRSSNVPEAVPWAGYRTRAIALLAATVAAAAILAANPTPAAAAGQLCGPRGAIVERLASGYKEQQSAVGLTGSGMLTELFVSDSGSWTIVFTRPDGVSCLMAAGQGWEAAKPSDDAEEDGIRS